MQISIEQHDAVMRGLVTEMDIQQDLLVESQADVEILRSDITAAEADRNLLSKQRTTQAGEYQRMLERIRQVATGEYPPCTGVMEPEWSQALAAVEILFTQSETARQAAYVLKLGEKDGFCGQCGGPVVPRPRKRK
jgi:septal ring factor EnvC (AmiA/AmiB activator)